MPGAQRPLVPASLASLSVSASPGSGVSRGRLLQDRIVQRQISHQLLQPAILSLQLLEPLSLVHMKTSILLLPPLVGVLRDSQLPAGLTYRITLTLKNLYLSKHTDGLLHRDPLTHRNTPSPDQ
jgi:hypothetical protein